MSNVPENDPTHRRLQAIAGAGNVYIFIVAGADQTTIDASGIDTDDIPLALQETIDALVS